MGHHRIIDSWVKRVREEVPAAKTQPDKTIINGLNEFLRSVADMIASIRPGQDANESIQRNIFSSRTHGQTRAEIPHYTLDQVITEYRILRSILFSVLEESGPLAREDRDRLLESIDNGMTTAATEFALLRGFSDARLRNAVAEKKAAANELAEANAEIEEMGIEREARENFVSALSHDLRNPLGAAKMSAQLISRDPASSELAKKHALRIAASIDRTDQMIRDLLDSNRIRAGEPLPLHKEECDLRPLLQGTLRDLSHSFGEKFVLRATGPVQGSVDAQGVRRIVENLATNALKYGAPDSPIVITLDQNENEMRISVHNDGNPISKSDQKTLFKQFRRTESAQSGQQQGWGIGLTLVRGITEAHGGNVSVHSASKEGTTFTVALPKVFPGLRTELSPSAGRRSKSASEDQIRETKAPK